MKSIRTYLARGLQLFFGLAVLVFAVTLIYFEAEKKAIRKEVKESILAGIDKSELIFVAVSPFNAHELEWEHAKEFRYKNHMYDVVEQVEGGYWCWLDIKESEADKKLNNLISVALGQSSSQKNQNLLLSRLINSLYFKNPTALVLFIPISAKVVEFRHPEQHITNWATNPPVPPPEFC